MDDVFGTTATYKISVLNEDEDRWVPFDEGLTRTELIVTLFEQVNQDLVVRVERHA